MFRNRAFYLLMISLIITSGCATLNRSECETADWALIGMSDGSKGYLESYVDKHRQACAKFSVTPDFNLYQDGHSKGLIEFCTERNGFALGRRGSSYNGACPTDLDQDFLGAYTLGNEIYQSNEKLKKINSSIKAKQEEMEEAVVGKNKAEQLLIHGTLTPAGRAILLEEIKGAEKTISNIASEISDINGQLINAEEDLANLERMNIYQ